MSVFMSSKGAVQGTPPSDDPSTTLSKGVDSEIVMALLDLTGYRLLGDRSEGWSVGLLDDRSVGWSVGFSADWLEGWSVGLLDDRSDCWSVGLSADWSDGLVVPYFALFCLLSFSLFPPHFPLDALWYGGG